MHDEPQVTKRKGRTRDGIKLFEFVKRDLAFLSKAAAGCHQTLADMIGCETKAVLSWFSGKKFPSVKTLKKIEDASPFFSRDRHVLLYNYYQFSWRNSLSEALQMAGRDGKRLTLCMGFADDDLVSYWTKGKSQPSYEALCRMQALINLKDQVQGKIDQIVALEKETNKRHPISKRAQRMALYNSISALVLTESEKLKQEMNIKDQS